MTEPTTTDAGVPGSRPAARAPVVPVTRAVLRVQHRMLAAAREYLSGSGFVELLPPIIGPVTDPAPAAPSRSTSTTTATGTS